MYLGEYIQIGELSNVDRTEKLEKEHRHHIMTKGTYRDQPNTV